jgi:multidrug efflux pump subunit AcrB
MDPAKLAAIGLTLEELRPKLVGATSNAAKCAIYTPKIGYSITANDQLTDPEPFNDRGLPRERRWRRDCIHHRPVGNPHRTE